jgi:hypothetical protein
MSILYRMHVCNDAIIDVKQSIIGGYERLYYLDPKRKADCDHIRCWITFYTNWLHILGECQHKNMIEASKLGYDMNF